MRSSSQRIMGYFCRIIATVMIRNEIRNPTHICEVVFFFLQQALSDLPSEPAL